MKVFATKRKAFDMAEQRKATDANGKGVEEDGFGPAPGRGGKRGFPGARGGSSASKPAASASAAKGKIPKWKL